MSESCSCGLCGKLTNSTGTRRCDACWELEQHIRRNPQAAMKVVREITKSEDPDGKLIKKLTQVIEDFLPNIGNCALQDYGRLNEALIESTTRLKEYHG